MLTTMALQTPYQYSLSVLGRDKGYWVKYNLCQKEFPKAKPEGTPEGKGLHLTVYPELSPNTDSRLMIVKMI